MVEMEMCGVWYEGLGFDRLTTTVNDMTGFWATGRHS